MRTRAEPHVAATLSPSASSYCCSPRSRSGVAIDTLDVAPSSGEQPQGVTKDSIKVGIPLVDFTAIKDFVDYDLRRHREDRARSSSTTSTTTAGSTAGRSSRCTRSTRRSRGARPTRSRCAPPAPRTTRSSRCSACSSTSPVRPSSASPRTTSSSTSATSSTSRGSTPRPAVSCSPPTAPRRASRWRARSSACSRSTGKLKGKTVPSSVTRTSESRVNDVIVPALKKAKVKTGSTAILNITGTDTTAGPGPARQLHREVEERGRQHGAPVREQRRRRSSSPRSIKGSCPRRSWSPTPTPRSDRPRASRRRGRSPTRTRDCSPVPASRRPQRWANKAPAAAAVRRRLPEGDRHHRAGSGPAEGQQRREVAQHRPGRSPTLR